MSNVCTYSLNFWSAGHLEFKFQVLGCRAQSHSVIFSHEILLLLNKLFVITSWHPCLKEMSEVVYVTIENPAFCLALQLSGVHFRGELQHVGHVCGQKIRCRLIRTREIGGCSIYSTDTWLKHIYTMFMCNFGQKIRNILGISFLILLTVSLIMQNILSNYYWSNWWQILPALQLTNAGYTHQVFRILC